MAKSKRQLDPKATPRSTRDVTWFLQQHGVEGVAWSAGAGSFTSSVRRC
jgi:hypothetical protein